MKLREIIISVFGLACLFLLVTQHAAAKPEPPAEDWYFTDFDLRGLDNRAVEVRLNSQKLGANASITTANGKLYVLARR